MFPLPSYEVLLPFHAWGIIYFHQVSKIVKNRLAIAIDVVPELTKNCNHEEEESRKHADRGERSQYPLPPPNPWRRTCEEPVVLLSHMPLHRLMTAGQPHGQHTAGDWPQMRDSVPAPSRGHPQTSGGHRPRPARGQHLQTSGGPCPHPAKGQHPQTSGGHCPHPIRGQHPQTSRGRRPYPRGTVPANLRGTAPPPRKRTEPGRGRGTRE